MADVTPIYGLRFLQLGDAPDLAAGTENLARDVETQLTRVDNSITAINNLNPTVASSTTGVSTSSTTFVPGATPFGVAFVAPPSGVVLIAMTGYFTETQDGGVALMSYTVRTGATIGSGTTVGTAANANRALVTGGPVTSGKPIYYQGSRGPTVWSGLTPGASYNARVEIAVDRGGGMDVFYRELVIIPHV